MNTVTIATEVKKVVHITWTTSPTIRMKANVDMPEYGLKADQVFYLSRKSDNSGDYYILTWLFTETRWSCPCKWGTTKAHVKPCRHANDVNFDCHSRKTARKLILDNLKKPAVKAMTVAMQPSYPATVSTQKREHAPLNGNRGFSLPKSWKELDERKPLANVG